jgi:hypothetical protein
MRTQKQALYGLITSIVLLLIVAGIGVILSTIGKPLEGALSLIPMVCIVVGYNLYLRGGKK